jgi:hypothetical protein
MAVAYNNQKVPTDGLVLYYDMHNPKSWKGEPTTNLAPNMGLVAINSLTVAYVGIEDGWKKYSLNGTWAGGSYPYSVGITSHSFGAGVVHSASVLIKTNVPSKFDNLFSIGIAYVNQTQDPPGTTFTEDLGDGVHRIGKYGFAYVSTTTQTGYIFSRPVADGTVFNSATDFMYIKEGQIEQKPYNTPYTPGTRSSTQAVIDLTKKHELTANNLSYSSENVFAFDGTTSNLTIPHNATTMDFSLGQTICMWIEPGTGSSSARRNPYNQAYGGPGTITHETNRSLTYFFGTHGGNSSPYASLLSTFTVEPNELAFVAVTRDQATNSTRWYKNGIFSNSGTAGGYTTTANGTSNIIIGDGYTNDFIGGLYSTSVYNRQLSDDEVRHIFEMSRHRYGI